MIYTGMSSGEFDKKYYQGHYCNNKQINITDIDVYSDDELVNNTVTIYDYILTAEYSKMKEGSIYENNP